MLVLAIIPSVQAVAADSLAITRRNRGRPVRVSLDVGSVMGIHSADFFRDYKRVLGGPSSTFNAPEVLRVGVGSYQVPDVAFGLATSYYRAVVRETYLTQPALLDTTVRTPTQTLSQDIALTAVPVFATVDYVPMQRQFTTYVGVGLGLCVTSIRWDETTSVSQAVGARLSGERYRASHIVPAAMVRAGVSLGLDQRLSTTTSAAVHIEVTYSYIPVRAPLFERVASQVPQLLSLRDPYTIQVGGIGLHAGVSLFLR